MLRMDRDRPAGGNRALPIVAQVRRDSVYCGGVEEGGAAAGGGFPCSRAFGTNGSGCDMPRWHVPQVMGSAVLRSSNCVRYFVLRSSVILIIMRAVSLTGLASEGKSLRFVS